jgi:exopolyphosphatase / guanosine-5'-triphosphate,3'-diphosphate pyrophosphatase
MKLAAIDIGSNAARLLVAEVMQHEKHKRPIFSKHNLVRVPLRLGMDVFEMGSISKARQDMMIYTMTAFAELMKAYEVNHYIAAATSAMRDAANGQQIIKLIKQTADINIEIISGQYEASLIYENHIAETMHQEGCFMYIDVGGGSTEITLFSEGVLQAKESFNIGTIRLLKNQVNEIHWEVLKEFIRKHTKKYKKTTAIGSGGNINKVFSLSKKKDGKPLTIELLRDYHKELNILTVKERIDVYKLREDRADVIVPALLIYINAMRWAEAQEIFVPKIGLADGLINHLYDTLP